MVANMLKTEEIFVYKSRSLADFSCKSSRQTAEIYITKLRQCQGLTLGMIRASQERYLAADARID